MVCNVVHTVNIQGLKSELDTSLSFNLSALNHNLFKIIIGLCHLNASFVVFQLKRLNFCSINLLVVYRESVNLIGCITRRLSADSLKL